MHFRHRQTDGLASWHKREMYILHLVLKTAADPKMTTANHSGVLVYRGFVMNDSSPVVCGG